MKKLFSLLIILIVSIPCFIGCVDHTNAQNSFDKWFCQSLKMNAILTGSGGVTARNTVILNTAGAGIYGTDTTIFIQVPDQHQNSWWSVYATNTRIGTGATAYFTLKASMDGVTAFDLPGDTAIHYGKGSAFLDNKKMSSASTPYYKFLIATSSSTYLFGPFEAFPFPYAALYIAKVNDSTTFSARIHFSPPIK